MSNYPEHDKQSAIMDKARTVGNFLDWLSEQGYVLAKWHHDPGVDELFPTYEQPLTLLAKHFEIDLDKIEAENRAMLERMREANG